MEIKGKELTGYSYADGVHWHWGNTEIAVIDQATSEIEWCVRKCSLPAEVIQAVRDRRPKADGKWVIEVRRVSQSATQGALLVQIDGETVITKRHDGFPIDLDKQHRERCLSRSMGKPS